MTDTQPIIDTATRATTPHEVADNLISVVVPADGKHVVLDLQQYEERPRRKAGTVKAYDANAFAAYVKKHGFTTTEVWADEENTRVVAVLNAHQGVTGDGLEDYAGWQDHRILLAVRKTPAWDAWIALNGKWLDQARFAEHIEDRAIDIVTPSGAEVLELAQSFQATIGGTFESSKRLSSGETQLVYKEEIAAKAGQRGQLDIPSHLELALVPFQGAPGYKVKARFRYRIKDGHLLLSYALERPEDVLREAFADVVTLISDDITQPVLNGWPE